MFRSVSALRTGLAALPFALCSLPSHAALLWSDTATHALTLKPSVVTAPVPSSLPMQVIVSLKLRNPAALKSFLTNQSLAGSPQYGVTLTPDQFAAAYSPSKSQAQAVVDYLASSGFTNIVVSPNRTLVTADGTAGMAQTAFNTHLAQFDVAGTLVHAPMTNVQVPAKLSSSVLAVLGLQNVSKLYTHTATKGLRHADEFRAGSIAQPVTNAGTPAIVDAYTNDQILKAYDAGTTPTGSGTTLAISTSGSDLQTVISDLRIYERDAHLPQVPVEVRQVAPLPVPQDTAGDGEWDLDSQTATGIAGAVKKVIFYNATDLGDSLLLAYNQFVTDNEAKVGNMSYGGCEHLQHLLGGADASDQAFMQAVAQGQSWFASSGDAGAACSLLVNYVTPDLGVPSSVEFPAASPYVTAVGGTSLLVDSTTGEYLAETAWDAGGGGTSLFETAPDWQKNDLSVTGAAASGLRAVPDVAMVAGGPDVGTPVGFVGIGGADIVSNGAHASAVGTSWSSPLAAGVWTRMQSARCNSLGFAPPQLYALDATQAPGSSAGGFHDILVGTNGEFVAAPGWDYTTGYGSMDIAQLHAALPAPPASCAAGTIVPPVARLTASTVLGPSPLAVVFDGGTSTDPGHFPIVSYTIDFGDGSFTSQSAPVFPVHTYAAPGTYVAHLTVGDEQGGTSTTAAVVTVDAFGTPSACIAPGQLMLESAAGSAGLEAGVDVGNGTDDLLSTSIGEPATPDGKLVFTMKMANLTQLLPGFQWVTYFDVQGQTNANAEYYFVAMSTANGPTPEFIYGTHGYLPGPEPLSTFMQLGTLDATSTYDADGTITLVLDKAALNLHTGDVLTSVFTSIRTAGPYAPGGAVPGGLGLTQDSAGAALPYTLVGNATCGANRAPLPALGVTKATISPGGSTTFTAGGSADPDAADTVKYFLFDFGDGTSSGWTTTSSVDHVYASLGDDTTTLKVADSRGLQSTGTVSVVVHVTNPAPTFQAVADTVTEKAAQGQVTIKVLANDVYTGKVKISAASAPARGSVSLAHNATRIVYRSVAGYHGDDTFTYTLTQGAMSSTATVTVHVK